MTTLKIELGETDNDHLGNVPRTAMVLTNYNDVQLQNKTTAEAANKTIDLAKCAKTNIRNVFNGNILYSDYDDFASSSATVVFLATSANFHLTSETDITLNNPTGIVASKCQKGIIVAEAPIIATGAYWKHSGGSIIGVPTGLTYDTYTYMYAQVNETTILLSFLGGIDGGI